MTRDQCYIANVVKCRPPENRDPRPDEIAACRPWLEQQIELIEPKVVVTLGRFAAQLLLDTNEGITKLRGRTYPFGDCRAGPTLHPAAALRGAGRAAGADASRLRAGQARPRPHDHAEPAAQQGSVDGHAVARRGRCAARARPAT